MKNYIEADYEAATGTWAGCDWTQMFCDDLLYGDQRVNADGESVDDIQKTIANLEIRLRAWKEALLYVEKCETSAKEAERNAKLAIEAYRENNLDRAAFYARCAGSIEREYGDSPIWGAFERSLEEALEESPEGL